MLGGFERALAEKTGHTLSTVRYDIADSEGVFQERYWRPLNEPVFDDEGDVRYIIHGVQDVTASALESRRGE